MYGTGRFLSMVTNLMTVIGGLAIALMMLHITLDIASRYLFNSPIPGTISIVSYYYMVIAVFIPLAFAEQKNAHISVEVVTARLPMWMQRNLERLSFLLSTTVFSLLTVRTWEEAEKKRSFGASVIQGSDAIPIWITYYVLPLGCGLMSLVVFYKLMSSCLGTKSGLDTSTAQVDDLDANDGMGK
ncbi:MAG: TRAP transporter small permease [Marinobacter sp.]|uniref:TRAP transporter small permease n=1 Tax=Marinobacter sp. AC-23 TaxID=1879031 RepID=UPI0008DE2BCD|nr:TRAP transporter small permease [Marinobacter sp. AC-23]OHY81628.1 C4-dicarboxylate ABC transporter substrate-binding protein [Marinobacter sp. AC-23]